MRDAQVHAILPEVVIEPGAVIGTVADEMLGLGFQYREVKTELD